MACDGGFQERFRHVLIPTRGFGKCPKPDSAFRYEKQECNVHKCVGDEICVAKQDLILAVDGSGSLQEAGFNTLKSFTLNLLAKYQTEYFGASAMKVGVLQFGNGVILGDGRTVSPAINVQPLTSDLTLVKTGLENLPFKKGFTNMAQAFALAEVMYTGAGRKGAQSAILVITDGKPSFQFQTNELVQQLDDKNVQRYFLVVNENGGDDLKKNAKVGKPTMGNEPYPCARSRCSFSRRDSLGPEGFGHVLPDVFLSNGHGGERGSAGFHACEGEWLLRRTWGIAVQGC